MRMRAALAEAPAGSRLLVRVNDPLAAVDIPTPATRTAMRRAS